MEPVGVDAIGVDTPLGRWILLDVADTGESASTDTPVVFGDNGRAMIGAGTDAGIVCRFIHVGVRCNTGAGRCDGGVDGRSGAGPPWDDSLDDVGTILVGDPADDLPSSAAATASLDRSSHFPRTLSILFRLLAARWVGFHRRVTVGVVPPVGLVSIFVPAVEFVLASGFARAPLRVDAVRSSRRVWYANGPLTAPDRRDPEFCEDIELERSIAFVVVCFKS